MSFKIIKNKLNTNNRQRARKIQFKKKKPPSCRRSFKILILFLEIFFFIINIFIWKFF